MKRSFTGFALCIVIVSCLVLAVHKDQAHAGQGDPVAKSAEDSTVEAPDADAKEITLDDLTMEFFLKNFGNPKYEIQEAKVLKIERAASAATAELRIELIDPQILPVGPAQTVLLKLDDKKRIVGALFPNFFCNCREMNFALEGADVWGKREDEELLDAVLRIVKTGDGLTVVHMYPKQQ
jgi:hypothetical protein